MRPSWDSTARGFTSFSTIRASSAFRSRPLPSLSTYFRTRACETSTSRGTSAPGRAKRARRIAFGTFARAPRALGASSIVRDSSTTSRSGSEYTFVTALLATNGIRPPTFTPPTVTPNAIGAGVEGGGSMGGSTGGGTVVVGGGGSVDCAGEAVPAPALAASPKAAANPTRARTTRSPAFTIRAVAVTSAV